MALGPSRRHNRCAVDSAPSHLAISDGCSSTLACKHDHASRMPGHLRSSDDKLKSSRRRVPFIAWLVSISVYCCTMFMRMGTYRALRQQVNGGAFSHPRRLQEPEKPTTAEKELMPQSSQTQGDSSLMNQVHGIEADDESDDEYEESSDESYAEKIVHVVSTRFMQGQSDLIELGLARLALFQSFCLPSMLNQSNPNFIWIIRADPGLHPTIVASLAQLLKGKPNFVLLGSNANPEGFGRPRGPFNDFVMDARVWSGNITLVEEAYRKSSDGSAYLLETRLDADDGLNTQFIATIQSEATSHFAAADAANVLETHVWRLWCSHSFLEWHPLDPFPNTAPEIVAAEAANQIIPSEGGYLVLFFSDNGVCETPGLTFGYGPGASRATMGFDRLRHDKIVSKIKPCKQKNGEDRGVGCVKRLNNLQPGVVRARTTTSAGMSNVITGNESVDKKHRIKKRTDNKNLIQQYFQQSELWKALIGLFSGTRQDVQYARSIMVNRIHEIADDNLKGQCTKGHSCKNGTKAVLKMLADG